MAKAYWATTYRSISKPDALAAYAKLAGPAILAAHGTPGYQEALRALGTDACVRDMRVVEGVE